MFSFSDNCQEIESLNMINFFGKKCQVHNFCLFYFNQLQKNNNKLTSKIDLSELHERLCFIEQSVLNLEKFKTELNIHHLKQLYLDFLINVYTYKERIEKQIHHEINETWSITPLDVINTTTKITPNTTKNPLTTTTNKMNSEKSMVFSTPKFGSNNTIFTKSNNGFLSKLNEPNTSQTSTNTNNSSKTNASSSSNDINNDDTDIE
jgi:hypothetical protein